MNFSLIMIIFILNLLINCQKTNNLNKSFKTKKFEIKYFKFWNQKNNKGKNEISKKLAEKLNHFFIANYNKKRIQKVQYIKSKKQIYLLLFTYGKNKKIKQLEKIFYNKKLRKKIKKSTFFNFFGKKIKKEIALKKTNGNYMKIKSEILSEKGKIKEKKIYDSYNGNIEKIIKYDYYSNGDIKIKKTYSPDITLRGYDSNPYLHTIEIFRNKKLKKKIFYHQETNNISHYVFFEYKNNITIKKEYNSKNKLIGKLEINSKGKIISHKIYDYKSILSKEEIDNLINLK